MALPHPSGDQHWTRRTPDRVLRGTRAPGAKLRPEQIERLCAAWQGGSSQTYLARIFGVSRITIWRHLKARGHL